MIIRPYQLGDENDIELTEVASKEWGDEDDEYALYCLHTFDSVTVIDGEYKNVGCFIPCKDGSEYVFFMLDRRSSPLVIKYCKQILHKHTCTVWSLAQPGQDKMHKFLGMVKTGNNGDLERWEKSQKQ